NRATTVPRSIPRLPRLITTAAGPTTIRTAAVTMHRRRVTTRRHGITKRLHAWCTGLFQTAVGISMIAMMSVVKVVMRSVMTTTVTATVITETAATEVTGTATGTAKHDCYRAAHQAPLFLSGISVIGQVRERMSTLPNLVKMRFDHRVRNCIDIGPMPMGLLVLVDQPCAHPFTEFRMTTAVQTQGVFHLEHLGQ